MRRFWHRLFGHPRPFMPSAYLAIPYGSRYYWWDCKCGLEGKAVR